MVLKAQDSAGRILSETFFRRETHLIDEASTGGISHASHVYLPRVSFTSLLIA